MEESVTVKYRYLKMEWLSQYFHLPMGKAEKNTMRSNLIL